ncbi:M48 family metalloprotease [Rhodovibrio sodomensis]|uniref:M48 family metalloprotease n=1 Tax=Rhodovibrio sodomensis TaxID=1088 RepID=UPI001A9137FE
MKHKDAVVRKLKALFALPLALCLATSLGLLPIAASAQSDRPSFIRDAEIEEIVRRYAKPVFQAAGLSADRIDVYLIADESLNAFVAGGMNMFLHTGLLRRAEDPTQVMGVIAHEAGHISAGHLASRRQELEATTTQMITSMLLGLGAAAATGSPGAGTAVMSLGQTLSMADLLAYTRTQEGSADQAAITYMKRAGYTPRGLVEFMRILEDQEVLLSSSQDPWMRTHPLTSDRVNTLAAAAQRMADREDLRAEAPPELERLHARMQAKLAGFLQPPAKTLEAFPAKSDAIPDRYARAIAYYRKPELPKALELVNGLIEQKPKDPYFRELKGQMLFENGRIQEALPAYRKAVDLAPDQPLIRMGLAEVQLQTNSRELTEKALANARRVVEAEPRNAFAWRLVGIAHGRLGDKGEAALALAEYAINRGDLGQAIGQAQRAQQLLQEHTPSWLRAQDIERTAKNRRERQNG